MTAAGPHSHTPRSQFAARGGAGRLAFGRPALPWLGFSVSEFKLASGVAHVLRPSRCGEGGHAGGLEGPKPPGATCPPIGPRWRTCSSPTSVARGAGQVAWRGPKPPGATRAFTWSQAAFGIYSRCFLHCFAHGHRRRKPSAPGAFCTVLPMSTGGVSHLLQVLFALFCSWSKWLKPPAFLCKRL